MTIDSWIAQAAKETPDKIAIEFGATAQSYRDLAHQIDRRAAGLARAGLRRGDRVAWYGLNNPEAFVLIFACARLGAIVVPLNWWLSEGEIAEIVGNCAPRLIVHDEHIRAQAERLATPELPILTLPVPDLIGDLPAPVGEATRNGSATTDDPILIVYTSGSTGRPKGAVLTQKALIANAAMGVDAHELTPDDRVLNVLPMFHVGGLNILPMPAFSIGATVVLHERVDPQAMVHDMGRVDAAIVVPTVLSAAMAAPNWADTDLSGLRVLSIGSTDVPTGIIEAVHARGVPVIQIYGATETGPYAIYQRISEAMSTVGSIGRVGANCAARLVHDDTRDAGIGEPGEVWVKGDNTLSHFWRDPDLTQATIIDGWVRTGDVATRDANGLYWFTDRIKHVVISGGENVYPAEIERLLRLHPDIAEVAVVGRHDEKWGAVPVAVIVATAPITGGDVLAFLDGKLARYKLPRDVVFVDALPRNAMGKVVAGDVRAMIER
jgi:fatty-acyl-CoA synthase